MLFNNYRNCDNKQRFSIRKLSIGACSVLLSTLFFVANSPETAHAETNTQGNTEQTKIVKENNTSENPVVDKPTVENTSTNSDSEQKQDVAPEIQESSSDNKTSANKVEQNKEETKDPNQDNAGTSSEKEASVVKDDVQESKQEETPAVEKDAQKQKNDHAGSDDKATQPTSTTFNPQALAPATKVNLTESKAQANEVKEVTQKIQYGGLTPSELAEIPADQKGVHNIAKFEKINGEWEFFKYVDGNWVASPITNGGGRAGLEFTPHAFNGKVAVVAGSGASGDKKQVVPFAPISTTDNSFLTTIRYVPGRFARYEFIDTEDNNKVIKDINLAEKLGTNLTLKDVGVVVPDGYELAPGASLPTELTLGPNLSQDMNNPTLFKIDLVHKREVVTEHEIRKPTVHYIYANGDKAGQKAAEDSKLEVYYIRTGLKDFATGQFTPVEGQNANWHWDNTYNEDSFHNGYRVIEGKWTLPQSWAPVSVEVPKVAGYDAITTGDWEVNKDGSTTKVPANQFVFPTYAGSDTTIEGQESVAYTPDAPVYEATPEHTVYFAQGKYDDRKVTAQFHYWKDGHDAGEASPNQVVEVLYTKPVTAIHTHGNKNMSEWTFDYAPDYVWDKSRGDRAFPGFNVISGKGWNILTSNSSFGITAPEIPGYKQATSKTDLSNNTLTFGKPTTEPNTQFTNDTNPTWYFLNKLTTYYVPNQDLNKQVTRNIHYISPQGADFDLPQTVTFEREARLNDADDKVVFGARIDNNVFKFEAGDNLWNHNSGQANAEGTWSEYKEGNYPLVIPGYTTLINGQAVSKPSIPAATVHPDTEDQEITVSFIKNEIDIALTGDAIEKAYNGKQASIPEQVINQFKLTLSDSRLTMPAGVHDLKLTTDDFRFNDTNGISIANPKDAGTYRIVLSDQGLDKFKALDPNFTWNYDKNKSYITYQINPVQATATLSGTDDRDYNGQPVSTADLNQNKKINLTLNVPGFDSVNIPLVDGDYSWQTSNGEAPTDVGTYKLVLSDTAVEHIQNYLAQNWNQDATNVLFNKNDLSGSAEYTIKQKHVTAILSGESEVSYTTKPITAQDIQNGYPNSIQINFSYDKLNNIAVVYGDDWLNWLNTADHHAPTNIGEYQIGLSQAGLKAINGVVQSNNPNYIVDKVEGTATVKVTPVDGYLSLTGNNGDGISYTGSPANLPLTDLLKNLSSETTVILDDGTSTTLDTSGLTAADFDWYDATGTQLAKAPTNAGAYTIKLNDTGLQLIKHKNSNYNVSEANNSYGFKIKKAIGTVVLSGNKTVTFGDNNSDYYQNYQVKLTTKPELQGIGYILKDGDLKFSKDGKNWTTVVPTNVGDYQVTISKKGWDDIKQANNAANIQWGATHITIADGTGYRVTPADASAVLSGSNEMAYRGSAVMASDLYHTGGTIKVSLNYPGANNAIFELKDGDYTWNTPNNAAPIAAGTYTLTLNDTGKQAIQAQIDQAVGQGNVVLKKITGSAAFTITPVTITVDQNGSAEKTYNGDPADVQLATVISDLNANNLIGGQTLNVATLTADDFDWYDAKGNSLGKFSNQEITPKAAGQYTVKLNAAGLAALKAANNNYGFETVTGGYQYTIKQADATISLSESNNQQTATWNGDVISLDPSKFIPVITDTSNNKPITFPKVDLTASDYVITQNGEVATAQAPGTYQVALTQSGWEKIRNAVAGNSNYNWTSTGNGLLTISKASAEITINGEGTVIYSGQAANIPYTNADNQPTYKVTLSNGQNYTLKDGDLEFVQSDHTNVGTYQLKLSAQGLANIGRVDGDHYDYTYNNGTVLLHVTPATATYQLSGNQNHTYNGSAGEINVDNYQIAIQLNNGQTATYTLQAGDIEILNGPAIARNTYNVSLTQAGLEHLKALNPNYDWDVSKSETSATFVVTPAEMTVGITGEANTVYNGSSQPLTQNQIDQLSLVWGGLNNAPEGVIFPNLTPADVEYTEKQADGSYKVVEPLHAGTYQVGLTQAAIKRLNDQYPNGNHTFLLGKSTATYIINQHKAKVTLSGSQTAPYTQATDLNLKYFTVQLTDPATGHPVTTYDVPLVAGDLVISGYSSDTHPVNVGNYKVEITEQLMDKLKNKYKDYDFGEKKPVLGIDVQSEVAEPNANIVEAKNNDGLYIITPINAYVHLTGSQTVDYDANGNYTIDSDKYSVSFDDELHQTIAQPNDFKPDFKFVETPTDAGNYKVTLDQTTLDKIKQIGYVKNELGEMVHNYEWIMNITPADYDVQKIPVTVTVANAGEQPQSSIYGQPIKLDNNQYQITLVDKNGQQLTYTLQAGDLAFTNGVPTAVGTFDVQLSNQGIENIEKQYPTKNYDFTNVHTATYVVKAATPTITITPVDHDGHGQKIYDAKPAEIQSGDFTITLTTNNGQTLNVSLNSHDLEFKNGTPTNVGSYDVGLKANVINQLKTKYPNYDWNHIDKTVGQYTITPATGSAELNGTVEKPYDGSPIKDLSQIVVTVNYPGQTSPTYTLQAGDYQFEKDGNTYTNAPSDVGDYSIVLTKQGKTNIAKLGTVTEDGHEFKNVTWPDKAITGVGHYIINPITIAVTLGGQQNEPYNGTPFGGGKELVINNDQDLSNCIQIEISTGNVQVPDINKAGLKPSEDFTIVDQDGKTVTEPINVGTYNVFLNQRGLDKLKKLEGAGNFTWPEKASDIKSYGQLVIAHTTASAKLSGNNSMAYTGQPVTTKEINNAEKPGEIKVTIAVKVGEKDKTFTYALQDGDYTWVGGIVPTEVGNYNIALNKKAVLAHLKETIDQQDSDLKGNFVLTTDDLSGQASFTITQGEAKATLSGQGHKPYDGKIPDTATQNEDNNIKVTVSIPGEKDPQTITLAASDFDWSQGGTKEDGVPTAAGEYSLTLNDQGIKAIKSQFANNKNIKWTDDKGASTITGQAIFTITQGEAKATLSGQGHKPYDGKIPDTATQNKDNNIKVTVTIPGEKDPQTITLAAGDFDWSQGETKEDGVPTAAGEYTLTLNNQGIEAIKSKFANNKNIKWTDDKGASTITGQASFTIDKAAGTITFAGTDSKTFDNKPTTTADLGDNYTVTVNGTKHILTADQVKLVDQDGKEVSPKDVGTYYVVLADGVLDQLENSNYNWTVTPNGNIRPNQVGTYTINPFKINVTITGEASVESGTTTIPDNTFHLTFTPEQGANWPDGWKVPTISTNDFDFDGHAPTNATKSGAFTVNFKGGQKALQQLLGNNYDVTYQPANGNYVVNEKVTEEKTITRTIIEKLPSGDQKTEQKVTLTRNGVKDFKTNIIKWDNWSTGKWDEFTPKAITGYTASPDKVNEETVTSETKDQTVTITYTLNNPGGTDGDDGTDNPGDEPSIPDTKPDKPGTKPDDNPGKPGTKPDDKPGKPSTKPNTKPSKPANKPNKPNSNKPKRPNHKKPSKDVHSSKKKTQTVSGHSQRVSGYWQRTNKPNGTDLYQAGAKLAPDVDQTSGIGVKGTETKAKDLNAKELPQTGEQKNSIAMIFGALAAGLGILGLLGVHKKKDE